MQSAIHTQILNFRKMKHDFATQVLREGKDLYEKGSLKEASIVQFTAKSIKVRAQVSGIYATAYECEIEIDRQESEIRDSHCGCPHHYDCLHLACLLYYLEEHLEALVVQFFQDKKKGEEGESQEADQLQTVLKQAEKKVLVRKEKELEKQLLEEYVTSASVLGKSSFFVPEEEFNKELGEISFLFTPSSPGAFKQVEVQLALRLPFRAKPIYIQQPKQFFSALQVQEPQVLGTGRYVFGIDSFGPFSEELLKLLRQHLHFPENKSDKSLRSAVLDREGFGEVLACAYELASNSKVKRVLSEEKGLFSVPGLFWESFEKPLHFCTSKAQLCFDLQYLKEPLPRILLRPSLTIDEKQTVAVTEAILLECSKPGLLKESHYFRFSAGLKRQHLLELEAIQQMAIPEQLFGCFVENAIPELLRYAKLHNHEVLEQIVTLPHPEPIRARCELHYAGGELEASLHFVYGSCTFPENAQVLKLEHVKPFVTAQGILARNIVEENALIRDLFQGFARDEKAGTYIANTEKKIVEFMTEVVPRNLERVDFSYPETLQNRFAFDDTKYILNLKEGSQFDRITAEFSVIGGLKGVTTDALWDCVASHKTFIALSKKNLHAKSTRDESDEEGISRAQKYWYFN